MSERQTDGLQIAAERLVRIGELEMIHHLGESIDRIVIERERLADFTGGAAAAIGDHVGGHRCTKPAVFLVYVLDDALPAIAARKIEIDVGPFAAFLGEKPLEEQVHRNRIDGRDAQAVADGAVGRRPATLHQNPLLARVIHDVPHDQEIAGKVELLDEIELPRDLGACLVVIRAIPVAGTCFRDVPEKRYLGLAGRHRIGGKAVPRSAIV